MYKHIPWKVLVRQHVLVRARRALFHRSNVSFDVGNVFVGGSCIEIREQWSDEFEFVICKHGTNIQSVNDFAEAVPTGADSSSVGNCFHGAKFDRM